MLLSNLNRVCGFISLAVIVLTLLAGSSWSATPVNAAETIGTVQVLLTGEGELEVAPHGDGNIYAPHVFFNEGVYQMWYGAQGKDGHDRVLYAESTDGTTWDRKGVVIDNGEANHVNDPTVAYVDGRYYLYYTRATRDVIDRVHLAVSDDGKNWELKGVVIDAGAEGEWDSLSVGRPAVLYDGGLFHLWYDGRKDFPLHAPVRDVPKVKESRRAVGYAVSRDGIHWKKYPLNPVLENNVGAIDVVRYGDRLLLTYESGKGTCLAESPNGVVWTDHGLFAPKSGEAADKFGHVTPHLFIDPKDDQLLLYVGNAPHQSWNKNQVGVMKIDRDSLEKVLVK
ncbi:hypothetical protein Pla110_35670 [Polystyrenella longa]|uniref:Glycosyl hydrolase family 32 N-terminal domain-containing protein n=1 Tax=Polystyrenella longa TaxID=2528007 RepID=A0A518CRF6_9PLAN|nr:hypothetical protein [Polystyrenella longa]QDU81816.1 hypothetical protein Pla110_35670 [Polystyrenella longa]